jgi:hypothetical protein
MQWNLHRTRKPTLDAVLRPPRPQLRPIPSTQLQALAHRRDRSPPAPLHTFRKSGWPLRSHCRIVRSAMLPPKVVDRLRKRPLSEICPSLILSEAKDLCNRPALSQLNSPFQIPRVLSLVEQTFPSKALSAALDDPPPKRLKQLRLLTTKRKSAFLVSCLGFCRPLSLEAHQTGRSRQSICPPDILPA